MERKEQWGKQTRGSLIAAVAWAIITLVEEAGFEAEVNPAEVIVDEWLVDPDYLLSSLDRGVVRVRYALPGNAFGKTIEDLEKEYVIAGKRVRVVLAHDPDLWGVGARSLYESLPRQVLHADAGEIKPLASRTSRDGIEYMVIYVDGGDAYFFEGEHYRVRLPFVNAVATIHTHPEGACMMSVHDIESGLDLLVEGGIFEAAATTSCAFVMQRIGPVLEDDFFRVKEVILAARSGRRVELPKLESILFYALSY